MFTNNFQQKKNLKKETTIIATNKGVEDDERKIVQMVMNDDIKTGKKKKIFTLNLNNYSATNDLQKIKSR